MKRFFSIFLLLLFLSSCSTVMLTGRRQLNLLGDSEITSMSFAQYQQFMEKTPIATGRRNVIMVQKVGQRLANAVEKYMNANGLESQLKGFKWEFNLVKGSQANAFCMPGGKVAVYEGILPYTKTETGLAVVLGHEIAHAIARHANERLSQQMLIEYGANLTNVLLMDKSTAVQQSVGMLYGVGAKVGVALPNSRKQELEADRLGLIFMAMAGYNPREAIPFWERMNKQGGDNSDFLSTHPSGSKRIAQIQEYLPEALRYYRK